MIGLDTTAIIDMFKGRQEIKLLLEKHPIVALTDLNYLELSFGIDPEKKEHIKEGEYYQQLFESVLTLPLSKKAARKAAEIYWKLQKKGKTIGKFDCIIVGIYLTNNIHTIVTRNRKHFSLIPEIKVLSY
jgi:predicted nucleic acid-binding protein